MFQSVLLLLNQHMLVPFTSLIHSFRLFLGNINILQEQLKNPYKEFLQLPLPLSPRICSALSALPLQLPTFLLLLLS
ncbi:hypothetical protein CW304_26035 [Bacillus sp. UFRGS-B20]|nr:hypothetical protein CW304_26035 [Bacillus sp. UFRGS-B20]